jgi:uncharacterized membrane protein YphA (DoxX/SURF4 family)
MSNSSPNSTSRERVLDVLCLLFRWGLGGLFIYMGLSKVLRPELFLKLVHEYDLVTTPWLLNSIAATLPWFEVFCGLLLVLGIAVRGSALMVALMLVPFTGIVLQRALAIAAQQGLPFCAVKFDCGCGSGEVYICGKLVENTLLLLLSLALLSGYGRKWSLRFSAFGKAPMAPAVMPPEPAASVRESSLS